MVVMILHFSGHEYKMYGIRIRTPGHEFRSIRDEFCCAGIQTHNSGHETSY